tara:strand:- start:318 stop:1655 length:1338 start_codon:yes stop_codon:yes gene_type:complete
MMVETIVAKRQLGSGRWDRALMKKMVELSVADNYEEAKEEWIATGNVWWGGEDNMPNWVENSQMGRGKCLCGHSVVYHFEIVNTENGIVECVGSDHINTYLIMKEISQRTGKDINDITQGDIDKWIQERTKTMMAKAWMHQHGKMFDEIYERIKEIDILTNVKGYPNLVWNYDSENPQYVWKSSLRKKSEGSPTDRYYKMASIVWRWEHPDNSRAQSQSRGYPTDKLWQDMIIFDAMCNISHRANYEVMLSQQQEKTVAELARREERRVRDEARRQRTLEDQRRREAERLEEERIYNLPENVEARRVAQERERERRRIVREEREARMARDKAERLAKNTRNLDNHSDNENFIQMCQYYGVEPFDSKLGKTDWEMSFLRNIQMKMSDKHSLSANQLDSLKDILRTKATSKQIKYLEDLGYSPENPEWRLGLTRKEASKEITRIKEE